MNFTLVLQCTMNSTSAIPGYCQKAKRSPVAITKVPNSLGTIVTQNYTSHQDNVFLYQNEKPSCSAKCHIRVVIYDLSSIDVTVPCEAITGKQIL